MPAVLGIDAAWTPTEPSGVALLVGGGGGGWRQVAVAPSYGSFIALARGIPVDWGERPAASRPDAAALLDAARALAAVEVAVVAVDMPLSTLPLSARRRADAAVSRAFGARGASTHSPTAARPGPLADSLRRGFGGRGYPLATAATRCGAAPALIEVYPHASLLELTGAPYRLPYKVSRSLRYHPGTTVRERVRRLRAEMASLLASLRGRIDGVDLALPRTAEIPSLRTLKRYEDALDALVCAWSAACYLRGESLPYGDRTAAIWVPRPAGGPASRAGAA